MDHSLYFPAGIAASDFNPFLKEVTMPVAVQADSTRPRAALKAGAVTRPVRRNLIELGLACGLGAAELVAEADNADAARRDADRAAGVGPDGASREADMPGEAAASPDPAALAALAKDMQDIGRKRDRLADELADLDRQRTDLQARLMTLLGKRGLPTAPEPAAPPPNAALPKFCWNR